MGEQSRDLLRPRGAVDRAARRPPSRAAWWPPCWRRSSRGWRRPAARARSRRSSARTRTSPRGALERVLADAVGERPRRSRCGCSTATRRSGRTCWRGARGVALRREPGGGGAPRRAAEVRSARRTTSAERGEGPGKGRSTRTRSTPTWRLPRPDATLVLVAAKPDKRRRPWKSLLAKADGPRRRAPARAARCARTWRRSCGGAACGFTRDALDQLIDEVGQDLRRLMGEVDKLEAWAEGRTEISGEDVAAVLGRGLGQPLYLLSDAFAARDAPKALELLERLLGDGRGGPARAGDAPPHAAAGARGRGAAGGGRARGPRSGRACCPRTCSSSWRRCSTASRRWSEPELRRALARWDGPTGGMKRGADAAVALTSAVVGVVRRDGGGLLRRGERLDLARQPALVPRGGVVVDDALLRGLVDLADRLRTGATRRPWRCPRRWRRGASSPGS